MSYFARALLILAGAVLLLPGACSLWFAGAAVQELALTFFGKPHATGLDSALGFVPIWLVGLVLGAFGVLLIVVGFRRWNGR